MKRRVLLLEDFQKVIPQRIFQFESYDLAKLAGHLNLRHVETEARPIADPGLMAAAIRPGVLTGAFFATSQYPGYGQYLRDILANLEEGGVRLFPRLEHVLAHENKLFQGIRLQRTSIPTPRSYAFGYLGDVAEFLRTARYPLVWKTPSGYGSAGVRLVRSAAEGLALARRHLRERVVRPNRPFLRRARERVFPERGLGRVLFQDFVAGCDWDWKILLWGNVGCGVRRLNRSGDFRASGSGFLVWDHVPPRVLEFAHRAAQELKLPWGSFDVLEHRASGELWLTEYQGVHFGLTAALHGRWYYRRTGPLAWDESTGMIDVEREIAEIIAESLV